MALDINLVSLAESTLLPILTQHLTGSGAATEAQTQGATKLAVPAILGGVLQQATQPGGAQNLITSFLGNAFDANIGNNLTGVLKDPAKSTALIAEGKTVLAGLFGDKLDSLVGHVASTSGTSVAGTNSVLQLAAPAILGMLKKTVMDNNLNADGLQSLLTSQAGHISGGFGDKLLSLLGWGGGAAALLGGVTGGLGKGVDALGAGVAALGAGVNSVSSGVAAVGAGVASVGAKAADVAGAAAGAVGTGAAAVGAGVAAVGNKAVDVAGSAVGAAGAGAAAVGAGVAAAGAKVGATAGAAAHATGAAVTQVTEQSSSLIKKWWWLIPLILLAGYLMKSCGAGDAAKKAEDAAKAAAAGAASAVVSVASTAAADVGAVASGATANAASAVSAVASAVSSATDEKSADIANLSAKEALAKLAASKDCQADDLVKALNKAVINFKTGSSVIPPINQEILTTAAPAITNCVTGGAKLSVTGHTDSVGNAASNQKLSESRALSVMKLLEAKGVSAAALSSAGFGADKPVGDNATPEGRFQNRRIEFAFSK